MAPDDHAVKEARKSRLPLTEQDDAIAQLQETIDVLMIQLIPVLTPIGPTPVESIAKSCTTSIQTVRSEVASTLSDNNARIRRITNKVSDVIERLEV